MTFKEFITKALNWITDFALTTGIDILVAIIVIIVGFKVGKWIIKTVSKTKGFQKVDPSAQTFIKSALNIVFKALVLLCAIGILGVDTSGFVAVVSSVGIAIGLAMQGSLANVAGGLMILMFHPFRVGNFINAGGVSGTVKEITILYTVLDTPDNVRELVPNGELANATVSNYSVNETRRVDLKFGVGYGTNIKKCLDILNQMCLDHELVLKDPAPFVKVSSYDDSAITVTVRVWVNAGDYWTVNFDLLDKAKTLFDENGIEIPFPQLDVHMDSKQ